MTFSSQFQQFVNTGNKPDSVQASSALLSEARSVILDIVNRIASGEIKMESHGERTLANGKQALAASERFNAKKAAAATAKPAPAIPAPAKPATQTATTTAAQFATPKLTITREDFRTLGPQDKGRFLKSGGTLV
jgi:hypothetical protein